MTTLEELLVKLDLDSAKYRAEMDKVHKSLDSFDEKVTKVKDIAEIVFAKGLATSVIHGAESLYSFVAAGAAAAEEMVHLGQITGQSTKQISELGFIAKSTGTSGEALTTAFAKLEKQMAAAAGGNQEAEDAFKAIGIAATDSHGKLRPVGDVFEEIAKKIGTYADGAGKTALIQHLFGKGAAEMVPILNRVGTEGFAKLKKEAGDFGSSLDELTVKQAAGFKEEIAKMESSIGSLAIRMAADLSPAVQVLGDRFQDAAIKGDGLADVAKAGVLFLKGLGTSAEILATKLDIVGKSIGAVAYATFAAVQGDFSGARDAMLQNTHEIEDLNAKLWIDIGRIWSDGIQRLPRPGEKDFIGPIQRMLEAPIVRSSAKGVEALKRLTEEFDNLRAKAVGISESVPKELFDLAPITKAQLDAFVSLPTEASRQLRDKLQKDAAEVKKIQFELDSGKFAKDVALLGSKGQSLKASIVDIADTIAKMQSQIAAKDIAFKGLDSEVKAVEAYKRQLLDMGGATEKAKISESLLNGELKMRGDALALAGGDVESFRDKWIRAAAAMDRTKAALLSIAAPFKHQQQLFEDANAVLKSQESSLETVQGKLRSLGEMQKAGALDNQQYTRAVADLETEFIGLGDIGRGSAGLLSDSFAEFFVNFDKGVGDIAKNFAKAMEAMIAKTIAAKLVGGLFSLIGGLVGGPAGAAGAGAAAGVATGSILGHADGGPVSAGVPTIVGERGPELFVPGSGGHIVSHEDLVTGSGRGVQRVEHYVYLDHNSQRLTFKDLFLDQLADEQARVVT